MIARSLAAGAMLAAAVVLAVLARDVWQWQRALHVADARASVGYAGPESWRASTILPNRFVRSALGIDDDLEFRRAASSALFQSTRVPNAQQQKQRAVLESELARISRDDADPARAASAADDLGALMYFDPPTPAQAKNPYQDPTQAGPSGAQSPTDKALAQFILAVRLDPSNAIAQRNLEVLLRVVRSHGNRQQTRVGAGDRFGTKGSGSREPGHGY